ncbi:hypothetical protein JHK82_028881 [Glycine max]|uniref:Uncharacterized protein n=1 Tax=Glycine max TaxID=3847 RepID=I1LDB5_SOYBN|nr:hypothetical protein JHK86_029003 [Glycine max]KAG5128046.1 hypothetical protein JHK82_028881 [Glycine max]
MVYGILFFVLFAFTLSLAFLLSKCLSKSQTKNVPKGSLGYPIIRETLSFLKAQRQDKGSVWLEERISKYGPIFKTSLMGFPTVFVIGQEGNKFVLGSPDDLLSSKKPLTLTLRKILGRRMPFCLGYTCDLLLFLLCSPSQVLQLLHSISLDLSIGQPTRVSIFLHVLQFCLSFHLWALRAKPWS